MSTMSDRYAAMSPSDKRKLWSVGVFLFFGFLYVLLPSSPQSGRSSGGLPANWREACDYVYTFGAGRLDNAHCARLIQDRPAGFAEAEWVRRIKIGSQREDCIREAESPAGKDACRMRYPENW